MPKFECNECDEDADNPCILEVKYYTDPPSECPFGANDMPEWRLIKAGDEKERLQMSENVGRSKVYKNSPKGRLELPEIECEYELLNVRGEIVLEGHSNNIRATIKEHHYDKTKEFSFIRIIKKAK